MNTNTNQNFGQPWRNNLKIAHIEARAFYYPLKNLIHSSTLSMKGRSALYLKITDNEGSTGWGEVWCNFPEFGSTHRIALINSIVKPLLNNFSFKHPSEIYYYLKKSLLPFMIQSGEYGPISQVISGIDIATWDLFSRKYQLPLARYINHCARKEVNTYASALDVHYVKSALKTMLDKGHHAFKLKIGFDGQVDNNNLVTIQANIDKDMQIFVDVNQRWNSNNAAKNIQQLEKFNIGFVEEPISVNAPSYEWQKLAHDVCIPLATGENIISSAEFQRYIDSGAIKHLQIDVAKWGGITEGIQIANKAKEKNIEITPHFLGGGIGLMASIHLLAAIDSSGFQEFDANENPLREEIIDEPIIKNGRILLKDTFGIGDILDWDRLNKYQI